MPVRYFIAMCIATALLAALFLVSVPMDTPVWSSSDGETQQAAEPSQAPPALPLQEPSPAPVPVPMQPEPATVPTFPSDRGGAEVARVVSPESIAQPVLGLPESVKVSSKIVRELPPRVGSPEPAAKVVEFRPPPLPPVPGLRPAPVAEPVPQGLAVWVGEVPVRPMLPAGAPVAEKPRDPSQPPKPPILARPPSTKLSFNDPSVDAGNDAVVNRPMIVVLATAAFVKLGLPDPFVYAEQVRSKLDPAMEPGLTPVPVNPRRPK